MIIIDGHKSEQKISNFNNLEEVLANVMEDEQLNGRVITDVIVNNESFSEIYPHQAEDMSCENISSIEIRSEKMSKMATEAAIEMDKVARLMDSGARNVARLFREAKDTEALELFQDLLDVTRDFMGMLSHLRTQYLGGADQEFVNKTEKFANLISEMGEVMENEDWILLSDLLEYEFAPMCEEWRLVSENLRRQMEACS